MDENDIGTALRSKLSPAGAELLAEAEERVAQADSNAAPEGLLGDLVPRISSLTERDREIMARLIGAAIQGLGAKKREAEAGELRAQQLLAAIHRAAELEGADPSTLTVRDAYAILEKHGAL